MQPTSTRVPPPPLQAPPAALASERNFKAWGERVLLLVPPDPEARNLSPIHRMQEGEDRVCQA